MSDSPAGHSLSDRVKRDAGGASPKGRKEQWCSISLLTAFSHDANVSISRPTHARPAQCPQIPVLIICSGSHVRKEEEEDGQDRLMQHLMRTSHVADHQCRLLGKKLVYTAITGAVRDQRRPSVFIIETSAD